MTSIPRVRRLRWARALTKLRRLNLGLFETPSIPTVFDNLSAMIRRQPKALSRTSETRSRIHCLPPFPGESRKPIRDHSISSFRTAPALDTRLRGNDGK